MDSRFDWWVWRYAAQAATGGGAGAERGGWGRAGECGRALHRARACSAGRNRALAPQVCGAAAAYLAHQPLQRHEEHAAAAAGVVRAAITASTRGCGGWGRDSRHQQGASQPRLPGGWGGDAPLPWPIAGSRWLGQHPLGVPWSIWRAAHRKKEDAWAAGAGGAARHPRRSCQQEEEAPSASRFLARGSS